MQQSHGGAPELAYPPDYAQCAQPTTLNLQESADAVWSPLHRQLPHDRNAAPCLQYGQPNARAMCLTMYAPLQQSHWRFRRS